MSAILIGNRQKALVHIAAAELGMDEETYRDFLKSSTGKTSSKHLTFPEYTKLMREFNRAGFRPKGKSYYHERLAHWRGRLGQRPGMATPEQLAQVEDLWRYYTTAKEPARALRRWLLKFFLVSDLSFLSAQAAGKAIEALKVMTRR